MKNYELMGLTMASGTPILKPMISMLCHAYLDWVNNYCDLDRWAESYGVSDTEACSFYKLCHDVYYAENDEY